MNRSLLLSPPSFAPSLLPFSSRTPTSSHCPKKSRKDVSFHCFRAIAAPLCSSGVRASAEVATGMKSESEGNDEKDMEFVEVGYVSSAHGLKGELRVQPTTGFPELRFSQGRRWLRTRVVGKELVSEVELIGGRAHPGKNSWIISISGIDTVEKAKQIVGSTLLINDEDRPELEADEFYSRDLVGMRVVLKESGRLVGRVVTVVNYGASDLLRVLLDASEDGIDDPSLSKPEKATSDRLVWIPFVEAIVPDVDMDRREMQITPPDGLLELNLRSDERSKKERRQLEWKERKRLQQRMVLSKRKLTELGQKHLLEGLKFGEKVQKSLLASQVVEMNMKLLQYALQCANRPVERYDFSRLINDSSRESLNNVLKVPEKSLTFYPSDARNDMHYELHKEGLKLLLGSKAATVLVVGDMNNVGDLFRPDDVCSRTSESKVMLLQELLLHHRKLLEVEEKSISLPLIVICPSHDIKSYEEVLIDNDYFGFDNQKVWLLEEQKLPIVSASTDQNSNKILLKAPWEILQSPIGSGGVFSLLSSHKIVDDLNEMGIEYVQICSLSDRCAIGLPLFLGFLTSCEADVGIKIFEHEKGDEDFDIIFSMKHLNKICRQVEKLQFSTIPEQHDHVELVGKEWVKVHSDTPNSYRFHCSIYTSLNTCSLDELCIMQVLK